MTDPASKASVPDLATLVAHFRHQLSTGEVSRYGEDHLRDEVRSMAEWAIVREPDVALIRAFDTTAGTIVEIVTDDMPFLVDSVTNELTRRGRNIRLVLHPQLAVERDREGRLLRVLDTAVSHAPGAMAESWMRFELERDYQDHDLESLVSGVRRVLGDVRRAVTDWPALEAAVNAVATDLLAQPPVGIPGEDVEEAAAFLKWIAAGNLTLLGYRVYDLVTVDGEEALRGVPGTGLGILRREGSQDAAVSPSFAVLPASVRAKAREPEILVITKANARSTVHRSGYLDYVGVKRFDDRGRVIGEHRILGVFAAPAYTRSVLDIPVLRRRFDGAMAALGFVPNSHNAHDLQQFLETYPRDELFQIGQEALTETASEVLHMQGRRQTRLFLRPDAYGRSVSALVYLPRDRYNTTVRTRIATILQAAFGGTSVDFTVLVSESVLARLLFVIRVPSTQGVQTVDPVSLEAQIAAATRSWSDDFADEVVAVFGEDRARHILRTYADAFPEAYKEDFHPGDAVAAVEVIESLGDGGLALRMRQGEDALRFSITRVGEAVPLSRVLPILQNLGFDVLDEHPYEIVRRDAPDAWILDFGVVGPAGAPDVEDDLLRRTEDAFQASWSGECEIDTFNSLVVLAGFSWRECTVMRAYSRYLRQIGSSFSQGYIEQSVLAHPHVARSLIDYFHVRFDPDDDADRVNRAEHFSARIEGQLVDVPSLDQDRILRSFLTLMQATVRTSYFRRAEQEPLAFKFEPRRIPDMPLPRPAHELWVYSPRVEGVHLRFGDVARGGLRWSDRREDFRTEILGLVKAQQVKNAVIVPVGAKGGFFPKRLPDPTGDREAWLAEGRGAYADFVRALLSVTDNLVEGSVVPPAGVVRYDGDDPYLVVAADKGTATFSDLANSIAESFGFWLGDAFASGGSVGYDHKAMGITARGAWESVKRHFRELGIDTQTQDFTVIGIGDMSGDVFGNGMLLSEHIRLVAAFDHRDIFIDPSPDAVRSLGERRRLFELPRSSWADYDASIISPGGGVFSRSAKSVPLTPQIREALDIEPDVEHLTPDELISAILMAPVDLLWNGGIGTYVKAQNEATADVGDRSNDAIRINGHQLRVKVVGEGGNLGLTQKGRIEAARHKVRLNTDAIDNSAGVDTSDHEVNIKILLDSLVRAGAMTIEQRNALLAEMTDDVARAVLQDNYDQNVVLGNARRGAPALITVHQRMIKEMERRGILDRSLESLPNDEEFMTLIEAESHLTSPELAVLLAYSKIWLTSNLNRSTLSSDPWFRTALHGYFPPQIRERFPDAIDSHPLRGRIIDTVIANSLLNVGGITFVYRVIEETGASVVQVVRAATAAMEVFAIRQMWDWVNGLDNTVPTSAQSALQLETRRLLDRATRWFLQFRGGELDIASEVSGFQQTVAEFAHQVPEMLRGSEAERYRRRVERFVHAGAPEDLAHEAASALDAFALLDITDICSRTGEAAGTVIPLYFTLSDRFDVDETLIRITDLPRGDRWTSLARQALRTDLYQVIAALTDRVIRVTNAADAPLSRVESWETAHAEGVSRARTTLQEIASIEHPDLATLSVCLRVLRNLVAQGDVTG